MPRTLLTLAFDTSTATAVIAVARGTRLLAAREEPAPRAYDEGLLPRIAGALAEAGVAPRDLELVACGRGPGSFTGLRIALATAKGYAFALGRPLVVVSSTAALATATAGTTVVVLDAKRGEFFAQAFAARGRGRASGPTRESGRAIVPASGLADWLAGRRLPRPVVLVGEGLPGALGAGFVPPEECEVRAARHPSAAALVRLVRREASARRWANLDRVEPEYLRPPPYNPPRGGPKLARGSRG
ncbi:MAG: tRNA (adenosine(37)-N6)-threonylcarbamoyltransferase complex dimerization subunit type 1 TsaB [Deltaproteobacteria bacterium]|nr:tRNA (adenosine(37)-N6)-threonylcarbamoyltransferase complex dimerization subunit type 1 TsaB [Deltaproteobacteria bacterium]